MPVVKGRKSNSRADEKLDSLQASRSLKSALLPDAMADPSGPNRSAKQRVDEAKDEWKLTPPRKKSRSTAAKKRKSPKSKSKAQVSRKPPHDWEAIYCLVEELRADRSAPVDSDGGEVLPDRSRGEIVFRFQVLIALMLSSQTKDAVVGEAMRDLQKHGLDIDTLSATTHEQLNQLIRKVGFHNNKTKYIKQAIEICKEQHSGDIPPNAEELMKLPGVGPKMAFIIESVAFNVTTGCGVDTHMHRIFNQLNWVSSKNPEQTRIQLESWLPREKWREINPLFVGLGQEVQQFKPKILAKALSCSRPADALRLLKKLGMDLKKEGEKAGLGEDISKALR